MFGTSSLESRSLICAQLSEIISQGLNSLSGVKEHSKEGLVVGGDVRLGSDLGVDHDAIGGLVVLGALVEGDFKTAGGAGVGVEVVLEQTSCLRLDLLDRGDDVTAVASAAAVLELNGVGCILATKDLIRFGHR